MVKKGEVTCIFVRGGASNGLRWSQLPRQPKFGDETPCSKGEHHPPVLQIAITGSFRSLVLDILFTLDVNEPPKVDPHLVLRHQNIGNVAPDVEAVSRRVVEAECVYQKIFRGVELHGHHQRAC